MAYKVAFNWSGPDLDGNRPLKALSCDGADIPEDEGSHAKANLFVQIVWNEENAACLTVNHKNTLQLHKGRFLYMDAGLWLKGQQTFGLVCGHEAALCRFDQSVGTYRSPPGRSGHSKGLLDQFLSHMDGVSVTRRADIPDPYPTDPHHLYVILPDMHVAEAPPLAVPAPPAPPPPYELLERGHSIRNPEYDRYMSGPAYPAYTAFNEAAARDFFRSRVSIPAMCDFLHQLAAFAETCGEITLAQVGDMYELWAGRPCLYAKTPPEKPDVLLPSTAWAEVGSWIGGTHLLEPDLFQAFDACEDAGIETIYLHGNHDNYTIIPDVIDAANEYIQKSLARGAANGIPQSWMTKSVSTCVHRRSRPEIRDNLFIEHGHRCDGPNRDGSTFGEKVTNFGSGTGDASTFDSTRRPSFVVGAAAHWYGNFRTYGLYVQGHTHTPVLEYVEVTNQREDLQAEWGLGMDGILVRRLVPHTTPLEAP